MYLCIHLSIIYYQLGFVIKIANINNLKEKALIFAHGFRRFNS